MLHLRYTRSLTTLSNSDHPAKSAWLTVEILLLGTLPLAIIPARKASPAQMVLLQEISLKTVLTS
jgi:hypothetical protein